MEHGVHEKKREVRRLSRGQSHDLLTHLEDAGLDPKMADELVQGPSRHLRAMIAAGAGVDWWSHRVCDWWRDVGLAIQDARRQQWIREHEPEGLVGFWMGDADRDEMMRSQGVVTVPGYGSHGISTGAFVERVRDGWGLFYMPPKSELPVEWFAEHIDRTVTERSWALEDQRIQWESRERGYWFWIRFEHRIAAAGLNRPSLDHIRALVIDAQQHPDAIDVGMIVGVLGDIIDETCASIEELLVAHACGHAVGWPLAIRDEKLVLRSAYASESGAPYTTRLLAMRINAQRIGFGYWDDERLADNSTAHGAGHAYRCAAERVVKEA